MHDRDTKFTSDFVKTLKDGGVRNNALPKASPNLNGRAERVILAVGLPRQFVYGLLQSSESAFIA